MNNEEFNKYIQYLKQKNQFKTFKEFKNRNTLEFLFKEVYGLQDIIRGLSLPPNPKPIPKTEPDPYVIPTVIYPSRYVPSKPKK